MPDSSYTRTYLREEFIALVGNIPIALLRAKLVSLPLTVPVVDAWLTPLGNAVVVMWTEPPPLADRTTVDDFIKGFAGGATSSEPIEINSAAAITATSATLVAKLDQISPPLEAGTYQLIWLSQIRMQAAVSGTAARGLATFTRSDGVAFSQEAHNDLPVNVAFNGALTFKVLAGQTVRGQIQLAKVGAPAATAEMSGVRMTFDKLS